MASLFNTRISDTYSGLIKTIDNAALTASLKELTDGSGLSTGVYMNNAGDFKVTAILEFGSLKDTGENIIISKFVDAADGIGNNDNDTTIPTTAAIIDYVAAQITIEDLDFIGDTGSGQIDLDSQIFAIGGTTNEITTVASGQSLTLSLDSTGVNLPDNSTAITQTAGDNSTKIATTSYVDTLDAASDLDITDGTNTGDINLNTQSLSILGTTNEIDTVVSGQGVTIGLPSTINTNLVGNVTGNLTGDVTGDLTGNVTSTSVLADGVTATTQSSSDDSTKVATTAYVKGLNNASDLDFTTDSGNGAVVLNSETLSVVGTTNEIETSGTGQEIQIGLPSSISTNLVGNVTGNLTGDVTGDITGDLTGNSAGTHTGAVIGNVTGNVTGDVTGDLTGNADTATAWETSRDLSLTGQATGTISSVDGTNNVSGAVTLDNNSVTSKVLTGLTSPSASSVLATDTIVEGFGKLQSQVNGLAGGLRFIGSWDADTNSPVLSDGGGEAANGTTTSTSANKLVDSSASFTSTVTVGDQVVNQVDGQTALVSNVDSDTTLSLDNDIMLTGEAYTIDNSPFITQGHYYVVSVGGTTSLNGVSNWTIGDWVIAGANNQWTKLDHSQVDGTGTTGNLTKWSSTSVIADSIVSESGTAITVDGSLSTNTNLSSTGDFAVNTDKFTVAAASGNTVVAGSITTSSEIEAGSLDINGNADIDGNLTILGTTALDVTGNANDNWAGRFENTDSGGFGALVKIAGTSANEKIFEARVGNSSKMIITGDGNSTFAGDVTVLKSGDASLNITSGTTNTAKINLGDSSNNDAGIIEYKNDAGGSDYMAFTVATTERMRIDNNGKIFLNNSSFNFIGTNTSDGSDTQRIYIGGGGSASSTRGGLISVYGNENASTSEQGQVTLIGGRTSTGNIRFYTGESSSVERLTIDSSGNSTFTGNVLIGSTSAAAGVLVVDGNSANNIWVVGRDSDGTGSLSFRNAADNAYNARLEAISGALKVETNSTLALTIDSSQNATFAGNVIVNGGQDALTINTTDSDGPYAVWKNTTNATLGFVGNANSLAAAGNTNFAVRATNDLIFASGGGTERMRINAQGQMWLGGTYTGADIANGNTSYLNNLNAGAFSILHRNGPDAYVHFNSYYTSSNTYISKYNGTAFRIDATANNTGLSIHKAPDVGSSNIQTFSQVMTVGYGTSNNVGIGAIPTKKLTVNAGSTSGDGINVTGSSSPAIYINETSGTVNSSFQNDGAGSYLGTSTSHPMIFRTANTERMRILSNGNVAFNATSNLNASKFQISTASGLGANVDVFIANTSGVPYANSATTTQLSMGFLSGTANYVATGQRLGALQFFGQASDAGYGAGAIKSVVTTGGNVVRNSHAVDLTFETKAAGSAGNEERMRITSGGDILVKGTFNTYSSTNRGNITLNGTAGNIIAFSNNTQAKGYVFHDNTNFDIVNEIAGNISLKTAGTERMRIDSSGNVTINEGNLFLGANSSKTGTAYFWSNANDSRMSIANTGSAFELRATYLSTAGYKPIDFYTSDSLSMRITSGGDIQSNALGSGTVGYGYQLTKQSGYSQIYLETHAPQALFLQRFYNPNGNVGNIMVSGTSTTYSTSSDYRLKEDLQDFNGLDKVNKIPVYDFKWKTDESRSYGVMAHELQEVLPDAVSGDKDAEEMQGVDYSKIVPLLVKSIQELKAEVDLLKQECKCKN